MNFNGFGVFVSSTYQNTSSLPSAKGCSQQEKKERLVYDVIKAMRMSLTISTD